MRATGLLWGLGAGGAAAGAYAAATWWLRFAPSWPTYSTVAGGTFLVGAAAGSAAALLLPAAPRRRLLRWARGLAAAALGGLALYALLWVFFTCPVRGGRVIGSWAYGAEAREDADRLAREGDVPTAERVLDDMSDDPDQTFEPVSLGVVRLAVLACWSLTAVGLPALAAVLTLLASARADDPALAQLEGRVAGWPAGFAQPLRAGLESAVRTLAADGNAPVAVLTVSGLLEGPDGLLGRIAADAGRRLKESSLETQIEDLRAKGVVPGLVASDLHWIRLRSNKARHEPKTVTADDARTALERAASVIEWYHTAFAHGPRLTPGTPVRAADAEAPAG